MTARDERILLAPALIFVSAGFLALVARGLPAESLLAPAALAAGAFIAHAWLNRAAPGRDPLLLPCVILLTGWGLLTIARVAPNFLWRQLAWSGVGLAALCAVSASQDRLRWLRRFKYTWLILALLLLASTLVLGVNPTGSSARLWLSVGGIFLQPSEVLRLLMIAFLAAFLSERLSPRFSRWPTRVWPAAGAQPALERRLQPLIANIQVIAPSIVLWLAAIALLGTQQDLGSAALLMTTFLVMLYLATGRAALPVAGLAAFVAAGAIGARLSARIAQRIGIWLNPWADPQGSSFQVIQSLISVASGQVMGQGIGQGRPDYVPAVHTDFPFAAVGEEFGLAGAIALLLVFAILILRAWRIARRSRSAYLLLLAGGLAAALAVQVFVIVGGNLGILPLTGVTLPFVSYGGSSLLVSLVEAGLLIRISADQALDDSALPTAAWRGVPARPSAIDLFQPTARQQHAARSAMLFSAGLIAAAAIAYGYWGIVQASAMTARDDNPRRVDAERAIQRGPILASDGTPLAFSTPGQPHDDIGAQVPYDRRYRQMDFAPVVGYYSLQHGAGGIEAAADSTLRGRLTEVDRFLHRRQAGSPVTTTISLEAQQQAFNALRGSQGAAVILNWRTGQVLALVSAPAFDPNTLDAEWDSLRTNPDAPLLNRATQGLYQPGGLLAWLNRELARRGLAAEDGQDALDLGKPVPFELENAAVPYPAAMTYSETIGQGTLRVTPLRIAVAAATLAAGRPVTPTLIQPPTGRAGAPGAGLPAPITTFAQIGDRRFVGWSVDAKDDWITVIALEQPSADPARLDAIRAGLP